MLHTVHWELCVIFVPWTLLTFTCWQGFQVNHSELFEFWFHQNWKLTRKFVFKHILDCRLWNKFKKCFKIVNVSPFYFSLTINCTELNNDSLWAVFNYGLTTTHGVFIPQPYNKSIPWKNSGVKTVHFIISDLTQRAERLCLGCIMFYNAWAKFFIPSLFLRTSQD